MFIFYKNYIMSLRLQRPNELRSSARLIVDDTVSSEEEQLATLCNSKLQEFKLSNNKISVRLMGNEKLNDVRYRLQRKSSSTEFR